MTSTINGLERKIQTLHIYCQYCFRDIKVGNMAESAKSHILSKRHKERTPSVSNIASLPTPDQDQYVQKGKDSNEPDERKQLQMKQLKRNNLHWTKFL